MEENEFKISQKQEHALYAFLILSSVILLFASAAPFHESALEAADLPAEVRASTPALNVNKLLGSIANAAFPESDLAKSSQLTEGWYWVVYSSRDEKRAIEVVDEFKDLGYGVVHVKITMEESSIYRVLLTDRLTEEGGDILSSMVGFPAKYAKEAWTTRLSQSFVKL